MQSLQAQIELSSDPASLEVASDPIGQRLSPTIAPLQTLVQVVPSASDWLV